MYLVQFLHQLAPKSLWNATFTENDGELFAPEVVGRDACGEVGRAKHTKRIINVEMLEDIAGKRIKQALDMRLSVGPF